jgi:hypothetical protein
MFKLAENPFKTYNNLNSDYSVSEHYLHLCKQCNRLDPMQKHGGLPIKETLLSPMA